MSAKAISFGELKQTQSDYFDVKADGLVYKYTRCDLCGLHVGDTSLRLMNNFGLFHSQLQEMNLIIFDCSKESFYNHCFHERCLKKALKEELRKDKKASQRRSDVMNMARCLVCYQQS